MARRKREGKAVGEPERRNLPAVRDNALEEEILEGEIVDDPEDRPHPPVLRVVHVVLVVVRHEQSQRAARHVSYIAVGAVVVSRRVWDSRTTARYDRFIRAAEAQGDHETALKWDERRSAFLNDRHRRRMERRASAVTVFKAAPWIAGGSVAVLFVTGMFLAIADKHLSEIAAPFEVVAHIVGWIAIVVSVSYGPALLAAPWIAAAALWNVGRGHASTLPGGWLAASKDDGEGGAVLTADTIVLALQNIRIPELKKAFKDGWRPTFTLQPVRDGRGYSAVFSIPLGVTAQMVADQRPVFARNLHRAEVEVWATDAERNGGKAGYVSLWVADPGVLSRPAPEYPLMHEGTADVFEGVPGGVVARGDNTLIPVVSNNGVFGGQMGQGKSNACRVYMLGCALDPLCELNIFVFANNGDFDSFRPRLAIYRKGVEDDTVLAAVGRLSQLYEEVGRREQRLSDLGAKKVTRGLAEAHPDMRPVVALFSECHELFGHAEYGEIAAELATKTIKRARKTGVVLLFDTQSSRKEAIPPKLVELVSVNSCFYVKTWRSNDGFLGDGSFAAGIRATELRPGRDRGTSVITGVSEAQFELLRWYFIEVDDDTGYDAATEVIARAMAAVDPRTPVEATVPAEAIEVRDLLTDVDQVLGTERVKLRDLIGLLRSLAPHWQPYKALTATSLRESLEDDGVKVVNLSGTVYADPGEVRKAIDRRDVM
ncbi:MAG TPA: hypothetical protein VG142_11955 [Trebonia sp.]|nr:hypothetical protein [Trebonia sp.]